jgi:hypothetical protein
MDLEAIVKYKMNELEAKAYKLCLLWEKVAKQELPNERHTRLRRKGDPRKSSLFKYCYKLARETKGLVPDDEYKLYITAQFQVLKLQSDGKVHALIEPCILVGDKAWRRWRVWKAHFDHESIRPRTAEELDINPSLALVELSRTKKFLIGELGDPPKIERLQEKVKDLSFIRWVTVGKVAPYYVLLSPYIKRLLGDDLDDVFLFDFDVYRQAICDEVKEYFNKEFSYEIE